MAGFFDFDKAIIVPLFRRDEQGRVIFFLWGVGQGRVVPTAQAERYMRRCLTILATFGIAGGIFLEFFRRTVWLEVLVPAYLTIILSAMAVLLLWAQTWPLSEMRLSLRQRWREFSQATGYGRGYLIFCVMISGIFVALSVLLLINDRVSLLMGMSLIGLIGGFFILFLLLLRASKQP